MPGSAEQRPWIDRSHSRTWLDVQRRLRTLWARRGAIAPGDHHGQAGTRLKLRIERGGKPHDHVISLAELVP
jgi:hypothetical protein